MASIGGGSLEGVRRSVGDRIGSGWIKVGVGGGRRGCCSGWIQFGGDGGCRDWIGGRVGVWVGVQRLVGDRIDA